MFQVEKGGKKEKIATIRFVIRDLLLVLLEHPTDETVKCATQLLKVCKCIEVCLMRQAYSPYKYYKVHWTRQDNDLSTFKLFGFPIFLYWAYLMMDISAHLMSTVLLILLIDWLVGI